MSTQPASAATPSDRRSRGDDLGDFWGVIPAGGAGTRLWPLSRAAHPKFLHDLTGGGRSMLQATVDRLAPLTRDRVLIVTGEAHAAGVRRQLPGLGADDVLVEPTPRDSMAAIGLAAAVLERRDAEAVLGSFAADHVISGLAAFHSAIREGVALARVGHLVTIGITPSYAATGFGYIRTAAMVAGSISALHVREFVEKPDAERATAYVASGEYRWNAGMFLARAATLLDLLERWHPDFAQTLRSIAAEPERMAELWPTLPKIAIDHAIAEPAAREGAVVVVPGSFGWDDVGDFSALARLLPGQPDGPAVLGEESLVESSASTGLVIPASGRVVVVVGLDDIVVVDTPDALLVTSRDRAQDVKGVVDRMRATGRSTLT